MLICDKGLTDKEQGQEIKEKEGASLDQTQQRVRSEIKETDKNSRVTSSREDKEINTDSKENGRTNIGSGGRGYISIPSRATSRG